jgi:hypothetical protein
MILEEERNYTTTALSKAQVRTAIYKERRVELALSMTVSMI